jgi:hypothetical protein
MSRNILEGLLRHSIPQLVVTLLIIGMPSAGVSQGYTLLGPEAPLARVIDPLIQPLLAGDGAAAEAYLREHAAPDTELETLLEQLREVSRRLASTPAARVAGRHASIGSDMSRVLVDLTRGAPPILVVIAPGDRPRIAGIRAVTLSRMRDQVTPEQRREILDSLYMAVERHYVAPDTALLIADHLRALDRAGVYDVLDNVHAMTADLTHDLRALNRDLHLSVDWSAPETAAAESAPEVSPGGLPDFLRTEWLSEGIGYLEIDFFPDGPEAREVIVEALRELTDARALIVDLRRHSGGDASHAELLASHFLPPGADLESDYRRATGVTRRVYAPAEVSGPRRLDVPLYILTSGVTGSAGESPAFVLGTMHARATIVGERTAGLGRAVEFFPLPHGFRAGISVGNSFDPVTKISLEVTGVAPHVEVPAEDALAVALKLIKRRCSLAHGSCGECSSCHNAYPSIQESQHVF